MIRTIFTSAFFFILLHASFGQYNTNYYTVKFPDDKTIYGCGAVADTTWPIITQTGNCNFNVGVSVKDQKFYTNSTGGCYKILRTWKLLYWCDYDPNWPSPYYINNPSSTDVGPIVTGNSSNHGYLQYTQIIKVIDTDPPMFINCPTSAVTFCDLTNNDPAQYHSGWTDYCEGPVNLSAKIKDACSGTDIIVTYRLFLDLDGNGSMETYVSSSNPTAWPIAITTQGDTVSAKIDFPAGFGLPYGKHKIEWIANDQCGNETICKYEFIVKDCKAPTIVCKNGLSINIMLSGMITLWDKDFLQYTNDNCTPSDQIKLGIRKANTGTGFPQNSHSVTFDCTELGKQYVEVWVEDGYGNADYCLTYVDVQDHIGACPPSTPFKGTIATYQAKAVPGVQVVMNKDGQPVAISLTGDSGEYLFGSMPAGCNYVLTPAFDGLPKLGVNTLDALLISGQLGDILPLPTPYQLLAADVDKSGNLSSADVDNLVKFILGVQSGFPGNTPWQFVSTGYSFPDPLDLWSASVPSSLTFCLSGPVNFNPNFVAVKTGDVNDSANPVPLASPDIDDRADQKDKAVFTTTEQEFEAGDEVHIDIITPDLANIAAFQFTLETDPDVLSSVNVQPNLVPAKFIALPGENRVTASWHNPVLLNSNIQGKNAHYKALTLVYTAVKSGKLSDVLHLTSSVTGAEAYTRDLETLDAELQFKKGAPTKKSVELFAARPNPVRDRFIASYYLPQDGTAVLTLTDATGRVMQSVQADGAEGYHETEIELGTAAQTGMMFLHLEGPGGTDVQRVMVQR